MIVRPKPRVWELFTMVRLSIVPRIGWQIVCVAVASAFVVALQRWRPEPFRSLSAAPFTLLGIALSIFLGFRNSACYDRWWEARRQLGALVGETRSLARLTLATPGGDRARRKAAVRGIAGFVYALMAHLRGESMPAEVSLYWPDANTATPTRDMPDRVLRSLARSYGTMLNEGEFGEMLYARMDERLTAFAAIHMACERIRTTPVPFSYTLLLHRTAYAFCFLLPFGLVGTFGWATPVFCALVAYAFFGLDALGDELQEPFAPGINALPLLAMARTMEINVLESLDAPDIPDPLRPIDSVLP